MAVKLFGTEVLSVYSHINAPHMNAIFEYKNFDVNLCFSLDSSKYSCFVIGKFDNKLFDINIDEIAKFGFMEFINAIKSNKSSYSPDYLLKITEIIDCLKRSADEGKKIVL